MLACLILEARLTTASTCGHWTFAKETIVKRLLLAAALGYVLMSGVVLGQGKNPVVEMDTSEGKIKIELFEDKAPITVKNFLKYVDDKHYDGTIFHRVMPKFMIQGGGFEPGMKKKETRAAIKNESSNGLSNKRGTIAMARTPEPDSASDQFYINVVNNAGLDKANADDGVGYAVFGQVIGGMGVVDRIKQVETTTRGMHRNVPVKDVVIRSARVVK
jgi:cyclophilin family peptidyl-prolyl cis-trans isomerase